MQSLKLFNAFACWTPCLRLFAASAARCSKGLPTLSCSRNFWKMFTSALLTSLTASLKGTLASPSWGGS